MPEGAPPKPPIALSSGDDEVWIERCCGCETAGTLLDLFCVVVARAAIVVMVRGNAVDEMEVVFEEEEESWRAAGPRRRAGDRARRVIAVAIVCVEMGDVVGVEEIEDAWS